MEMTETKKKDEAMQEGRESSIEEVKERIIQRREQGVYR